MKKMIVFCLFMIGFSWINTAFSQDEVTIDRKIRRFVSAETSVYKLPIEKNELRTVYIPQINENRTQLAPHCPVTNGVFHEENLQQVQQWIELYPNEFQDYIVYLERFIRTNR
jgi:hypothetical protein